MSNCKPNEDIEKFSVEALVMTGVRLGLGLELEFELRLELG